MTTHPQPVRPLIRFLAIFLVIVFALAVKIYIDKEIKGGISAEKFILLWINTVVLLLLVSVIFTGYLPSMKTSGKKRWVSIMIVVLVIGIVAGQLTSAKGYFSTLLFFSYPATFLLSGYIGIYIHEFGHALAGSIMGFHIHSITIGTGRELFRKQVRGIFVVITNSFGVEGMTIALAGNMPNTHLRFRYLVYVLGGIIAQGIAVIVTIILLNINLQTLFHPPYLSLGHMFIYSNLLTIGLNLLPSKILLKGTWIANDGLKMIQIFFWNERDIRRILSRSSRKCEIFLE